MENQLLRALARQHEDEAGMKPKAMSECMRGAHSASDHEDCTKGKYVNEFSQQQILCYMYKGRQCQMLQITIENHVLVCYNSPSAVN